MLRKGWGWGELPNAFRIRKFRIFTHFIVIDASPISWYPSASKDTSKFTLERGRCWLTGTPVSLFVRLFRMNELVPETNFLFC